MIINHNCCIKFVRLVIFLVIYVMMAKKQPKHEADDN